MLEVHCDNVACNHNKDGLCIKEGIHVDEIGFCRDAEE